MNKIKIASLIAVLALLTGVNYAKADYSQLDHSASFSAGAGEYHQIELLPSGLAGLLTQVDFDAAGDVTIGGAFIAICEYNGEPLFTGTVTSDSDHYAEGCNNNTYMTRVWHFNTGAGDTFTNGGGGSNLKSYTLASPITLNSTKQYLIAFQHPGMNGTLTTPSGNLGFWGDYNNPTGPNYFQRKGSMGSIYLVLHGINPSLGPATVSIINPANNATNISPVIPSWDVQYHINDDVDTILVNHPGLLTVRYSTATSTLDTFGSYFQDNRYVYNDDTGSGFVPVNHSFALGVNTRWYARVTWYDSDYTSVIASSTITFVTNNPAAQSPGNYDFGFRFNSTSSDAAIFRSTTTQFRATSTYVNDISAHCSQTGDFSVWNPQDWFCVVTDGISNMFQIMQDKVTVAYNRIILVFQSIFPLNVYADINNDLDAAQASSTIQTDIILTDTSHHIFGGHSFTILNSSTTAWVKDDANFDYKRWFDYMLYGVTGMLIIGTALMVIKSIHNSSVNQS